MLNEGNRIKKQGKTKRKINEFSQKKNLLIIKKTVSLEQREQKTYWNELIRELEGGREAEIMKKDHTYQKMD